MTKEKFPGFSYPEHNWYQFPKSLNGYMSQLSGNEFKVLAYIVRKTWGFNKLEDRISYSQFLKGVKNKEGVKIFDGLGMGEDTLRRCLKSLKNKGFIEIIDGKGYANTYKLKYGRIPTPPQNTGGGGGQNTGETPPQNTGYNKRLTIKDNTIKLSSKEDRSKAQTSYGNSNINEILDYLKKKAGWIDGSQKQQRYGCKTFISRMKKLLKEMTKQEPTEKQIMAGCKKVIDLASQDDFHSQHLGKIKYLYDNIGIIIKSKKRRCSVEERKA